MAQKTPFDIFVDAMLNQRIESTLDTLDTLFTTIYLAQKGNPENKEKLRLIINPPITKNGYSKYYSIDKVIKYLEKFIEKSNEFLAKLNKEEYNNIYPKDKKFIENLGLILIHEFSYEMANTGKLTDDNHNIVCSQILENIVGYNDDYTIINLPGAGDAYNKRNNQLYDIKTRMRGCEKITNALIKTKEIRSRETQYRMSGCIIFDNYNKTTEEFTFNIYNIPPRRFSVSEEIKIRKKIDEIAELANICISLIALPYVLAITQGGLEAYCNEWWQRKIFHTKYMKYKIKYMALKKANNKR